MDQDDFSRGAIVRGHPSAARKVCDWRKAFETYLGADATSTDEAYLSAFTYPAAAFIEHVKAHGFGKYPGAVYARYISMDFDHGADPAAAIEGAQKMLSWLEATAQAELNAVTACYSGSKGAHIRLPVAGTLVCAPSPHFPKICKAFALLLARAAGAAHLDAGIYDAARILRLPNTRHPKSGRLCVPFTGDDFVDTSPEAIMTAGDGDLRDGLPNTDGGAWCDWTLQDYWNRATAYVEKQANTIPAASAKTDLNRATLEFIQAGAANGERHNRLFQAAANLGEFNANERLARALLMEAARDSGLPLSEIEATIKAGVAHGRA